MQERTNQRARRSLWLTLAVLVTLTALIFIPSNLRSKAKGQAQGDGLFSQTRSHVPGLENYDVRTARTRETADHLLAWRNSTGKTAVDVAQTAFDFVRGEAELRTRVPSLKIEYNDDLSIPEVISPDVWKAEIEYFSPPSAAKRSDVLRGFVKSNNSLVGMSDEQADELRVLSDYANPDGNMAFAHLEQLINGVPVFRGEIKAGFTKDGRMFRVINNLAPGLDYDSLSMEFGDPSAAVRAAARHIDHELRTIDTVRNEGASTDLKIVFGEGDSATTAERMYFPTEPGVAIPAWRVLIYQPVTAYYVIVDRNGTMLWRKNIGEDQTQSATYNIYRNANSYLGAADSPAPLSPYPPAANPDPTAGTQGTNGTRSDVTLIGNEAPYTFNNLGWITDATNISDGNNVEAGVDRVTPDGVDAPLTGNPNRVFTTGGAGDPPSWNPPPGSPAPGDEPLIPQSQRGAVTQMFYVMNRYHDELYRLGFTEPAFNFQNDNFGRGGTGNDRVRAEGQDSSGSNNANFLTPADGGRGRMQMYLWTGPTPDYDGTGDAEVIIHEVTHGTSNRLHGNAAGLSTNMARGMGEGWGDFFGYTMLAEPTDPINAVYTTGGYATYLIAAGFTANYYYGIRRFPRAPITFLGANGKPHNPFTFQYVNNNCNTLMGTPTSNPPPNSAFPRGPIGSATCDQVHNLGEVWSSMLWEVRNRMVSRLGFSAGTQKALQVVTDGMKLAPIGPTFLTERDAIIAGALATGTAADVQDIREGFRVRGLGFSASIQNAGTGANNTAVTEAFDVPNVVFSDPFSVSDSPGDNDGFPEPGEDVLLNVSVTNQTGATITNVQINVGGPNVSFGTINHGATVTMPIPYRVPGTLCGSLHTVTINGTSSVGALNPQQRTFRVGAPIGGAPVSFANTAAITIPSSGPSTPYPSTITVSGLTGVRAVRLELTDISHVFPDDVDFMVQGPNMQTLIFLSDAGGTNDWVADDIQITDLAPGPASDSGAIPTGEYKPTNYGANDPFDPPAPAGPYGNPAPAGTDTFESQFGTDGSAMNGDWKLFIDDDLAGFAGTIAGGWKLTFESNAYACDVSNPRADFDGDGRTDFSVFRPSEGNWYLNQSTAGFGVLKWGVSTDTLVPGDWDGDGRADTAVFRVNPDPAVTDFLILNSNGFTVSGVSWGVPGDIPLSGDYDGDSRVDAAVYRPSDQTWYILNSFNGSNTIANFGSSGDIPFVMDHDGDGKDNLAVFRPSTNTWYIARATGVPAQNFDAVPFGVAADKLVPADYDGDGKDDVAVYRPSNGTWYILRSSNGAVDFKAFGNSTDVPVPGDYDGDGKYDVAVYRNGTWYVDRSTAGFQVAQFGVSTDLAIPAEYVP